MNIKITPAMVTLWHVAATVTGGVMLPILLGLFQYVSSHGANVGQDISYGIPVLVGGLATLPVSIWHAVKANPALPQAETDLENDAANEAKNLAQQALATGQKALDHIEQSIWPALHQLNTQQAAQKAATPVVAQMPVGPANIQPQGPAVFSLPSRSFTQSALMPAVPKQ